MTRLLVDVDTAMGIQGGDIDDAHAIALLASRPGEFELQGITVTAGNVSLYAAARSTRFVCDLLGLQVPIVEGADGPLQGRLVTGHSIILKNPNAPEDWILDRFPPPPTPGLTAWDFMASVLEQGATTILATAPLTNIARFLQAYPALAGRITRIVNMGGWYHTANGRSEFNIMVDPHAAEIVLKAGIPMLLVPLEMTMQALLQRDETEGWRQMGECGRLYYEGTLNWLYHLRKLHGQEGCHLHDPLAAGLLIQPDLCESVGIVPEVNLSNGVTRIAALDESSPVRLVTDFDREGFKRLYLAAMEESFKGSTLLSSPHAE